MNLLLFCLEPVEQTRGVSTAQCEFQSVGGVLVSNYPFIVHVASQQESVAPPPPRLPAPIHSYHIMLGCVCQECVEPNQITVWAPCVHLLMKTMFRFNWNLRIFSAASQKQEWFTLGWRWLRWKKMTFWPAQKHLRSRPPPSMPQPFPQLLGT